MLEANLFVWRGGEEDHIANIFFRGGERLCDLNVSVWRLWVRGDMATMRTVCSTGGVLETLGG